MRRAAPRPPRPSNIIDQVEGSDPYSGEAYTALGAIGTNFLFDWNAAEQNLRKGIELSPSSSDAETWYAVYLTSVGRPAETPSRPI
jgi:hypothetical protein